MQDTTVISIILKYAISESFISRLYSVYNMHNSACCAKILKRETKRGYLNPWF